jgi:hypothetical protein
MSNLYIFAAIFLFWTALTASLMQVQLVASPMHKLRLPTYRSTPMRATVIAQVNMTAAVTAYN